MSWEHGALSRLGGFSKTQTLKPFRRLSDEYQAAKSGFEAMAAYLECEALMRRFAMERARNPDFYRPEWSRSK